MALPPPIATTTSQPSVRASAVPRRISSMDGSPETAKATPATTWRPLAPVTNRGRRPIAAAAASACWNDPSPKTIRPEVANSKVMLPALIAGEDVVVEDARARFGEPRGHLLGPGMVMRSLLVGHSGFAAA